MPGKVLSTARAFRPVAEEAGQPLRDAGYQLVIHPKTQFLDEDELLSGAADCIAIIAGSDAYTSRVLDSLPELRTIARWGVGYDSVDLEAATRNGIVVTNTPGMLSDAVADLTFALMLAVARKLKQADRTVRQRRAVEFIGDAVHHRCLGLIGCGGIGRAVARRAQGFDMRVLAYDPLLTRETAAELGVELVSLDELLEQADFVSPHCNYTPESHHLIGAQELALMKPTAYLINTSRGPIVDETALIAALQTGSIAGAGLDVFEQEPPSADNPLLHLDNCVVSPHIGYNDRDTILAVSAKCVDNVLAVLRGEPPDTVVNPAVYA